MSFLNMSITKKHSVDKHIKKKGMLLIAWWKRQNALHISRRNVLLQANVKRTILPFYFILFFHLSSLEFHVYTNMYHPIINLVSKHFYYEGCFLCNAYWTQLLLQVLFFFLSLHSNLIYSIDIDASIGGFYIIIS